MQLSEQEVRGAVARGWCHEKNAGKEIDVHLAEAIVKEVLAINGAKADARPVAWTNAKELEGVKTVSEGYARAIWGAENESFATIPLFTHPEASAPGLSEDEWLALAERHIKADWNSEQPDGYLNAVKALAQDAMSLTRASHQPSNAEALGLSKDEITDVWIKHGGPLNGNNFHSFARAILTRASADQVKADQTKAENEH